MDTRIMDNPQVIPGEIGKATDVRTFGFDLDSLLGAGWRNKVKTVENRDFMEITTEKGPDRHISKVELQDGRVVEMTSARVRSGNPFEQMEHLGGVDLRKTENWLYAYDPQKKLATIVSPDSSKMNVDCSREDFDTQMNAFETILENEQVPIASFNSSNPQPPPLP